MIFKDNCATSLEEIPQNEIIEISKNQPIKINQVIPYGHKFTLSDIKKGEKLLKYRQIIKYIEPFHYHLNNN